MKRPPSARPRSLLGFIAALAAGVSCSAAGTQRATRDPIVIQQAVAPAPVVAGDTDSASMAVYFSIRNAADVPDTLVAAESPSARSAGLHEEMRRDGAMMMMMPAARLPIPPHGAAQLAPGGVHLMLDGLRPIARAGDTILVALTFAHAGRLSIRVPVVRYDQLDSARDAGRVK